MKKIICALVLLLIFTFLLPAQEPTPGSSGGEVRFVPQHLTHVMLNLIYIDSGIPGELLSIPIVIQGDFTFTNEVHVNTGNQLLVGYGMDITFDPSIVVINTEEGDNGISGGPEDFIIAVNTSTPGIVGVSGFDATGMGVGPESDLHLFTIHWYAQTYNGTTELSINIDHLEDNNSNQVGTPTAQNGSITLETIVCVLGDFNSDGGIDIVDALVAAQYYVGLEPSIIDLECGDVNCDGRIDIVDALMIAQYFVGLIDDFFC